MISLAHALRASARKYPDHAAIIGSSGVVDYATFDRDSDAIAASLVASGVAKGDRIGLYCSNSEFFAVAYAGIVKAGAVVVPINLLLTPGEIGFILNDCTAKGLIFQAIFSDQAIALSKAVDSLEFTVSIGAEVEGALSWEKLLQSTDSPSDFEFDPEEDLAVIIYTSGTTGKPKGAMLTHGNLLANVASVQAAMKWQPGTDVVLVVLPMFHAFAATVGMLTPLTCGCAIVPLPRFEPEQVAQTIHSHGVTVFLGVPSMYSVLLRLKPDRVPLLASLRACVSGGAAMPVEVMRRFEAYFGQKVYEGDGPTECSPVTCVNPIGGKTKPGTVGLAVPGVEMRIVGEEGVGSLPRGEAGEIAVRGANVMKGYWNQPDATREVFRDGWFLTGDIGTEDEDGYFSIVDRKKDLIIVNGMNVYPRVVEEVIHQYPGIREVAVVGELEELHGEIPVAFVVVEAGSAATEGAIRGWCRQQLGRHQVPRKVIFLDELPRNAAGKVLKRQLRLHGEVERGIRGLD
ncbi:MAG: long-chain fatty acid--CoA ligase [Methylococcaceae bacterium]|nr:long-chain fatty acid--CoA ligase [Methylococcaceae bacterium]